jgi:hypothetical protein
MPRWWPSLGNGYGAEADGCFRDKFLEGFYLCQGYNAEGLLLYQLTPNLRFVTRADDVDHDRVTGGHGALV